MTSTDPIYAVGDIHGYPDQLDRALALIDADGGAGVPAVFVGDYVDRGPDSRGVIDRLMTGQAQGLPWHCLKGNHDRLFQSFLEAGEDTDEAMPSGLSWMNARLGGVETLASYGVTGSPVFRTTRAGIEKMTNFVMNDAPMGPRALCAAARRAVPDDHLAFLKALSLSHRHGDLFFCHAGIRPGVPLDAQTEDDLVWIRREFHDDPRDHGPLIIHGHTPVKWPTHFGNRVDIDSGAGHGNALVPVVIEGRDIWALTPTGRQPVTPAE